jgi:small subunit ribosomal protein S4
MKVGPRYKIGKRLGSAVFEKCQTQKFTLSEQRSSAAKRGRRRRGGVSDYGKQLLEKQRVRFMYGITEKQLSRYVKTALKQKGETATENLLKTLETRLDNTVFRFGLAPTRRAARQMVAHGHIQVNGKKMTIPSHQVGEGDTVTVREKSKKGAMFTDFSERVKDITVPTWLKLDSKKLEGSIRGVPAKDNTETPFDMTVVMEYYSR